MKTDIPYSSNLRPRSKVRQHGSSPNYGLTPRPLLSRLRLYQEMVKFDPVIRQSIDIILDSLVGALGSIEHPDKDIKEYLDYTISRLQHEYGVVLNLWIKRDIKCALWAGFSVSEKLLEVVDSTLVLRDLVLYHPASITIRTNDKGRLVEDESSIDGLPSGIYQNSYHSPEVKLPLWKVTHLINDFEFNNYYGNSILEACYRWHILKEAFVDMFTLTLDRYGNPLTVISLPKMGSGIEAADPITGDIRQLSAQEVLEQQIQSMNPRDGNVLFLPYVEPNLKPDIKTLTSANNLGDIFLEGIKFTEVQITRNLLIPYGFVESKSGDQAEVAERQIEMFNKVIRNLYNSFIIPWCAQTFHTLIKLNFNRESASIPPRIPLRNNTRPEARVAMMQMIKGLTDQGYFNPTNKVDWEMVREMVDALPRVQDKQDVEFVKQLLVYPRQPKEGTSGVTDPKRSSERAGTRQQEGSIQGTGNPGRSVGDRPKEQNKKPITPTRPTGSTK